MNTLQLQRGTLVRAIKLIDPNVAHAVPGTLGVVFEPANYYGDGGGPMVRWFTGTCCNVYDGEVEKVVRSP